MSNSMNSPMNNTKNNEDGNIYYDEDDFGEGLNSKNNELNEDLNNESKTSFSDDTQNDLRNDNIGHFIIIINNHPTCIIYPLYYINCFNLENYLKNDCGFKNVVWNYNIIQHGNSSSCGWECCKIAYDYFVKNNIEVECRDYKLIDI